MEAIKGVLDEYEALRELLQKRCRGSKFNDADIKSLGDAGFESEADLKAADRESLIGSLPGQHGKVAVLFRAFAQSEATTVLESGRLLGDNHPLSKFVACLKDSTLQESLNNATSCSVIKLPEGIVWLGDESSFSNELFMRPCYFELLEAKEEYFKSNRKLNTVVYTGTPGIEKSHLCAYVVARKLVAGTVVFFETVLQPLEGKGGWRIFFRLDLVKGVSRLESFGELDFLPADADVVHIIDGGPPSNESYVLETQIFASPSKALFVPRTKCWNYLYLHTPLFDLEEICSCRSAISEFATKVTKEIVEGWFFVVGGVARAVLKESSSGRTLASWQAGARIIIGNLEMNALKGMIGGLQQDTFCPGSDLLFHWLVDEKNVQAFTTGSSPEK